MKINKAFSAILFLIIVVIASGCTKSGEFPFVDGGENIVSVEIVNARSSKDYDVLRVLDENETDEFLTLFREITFKKYIYAEPYEAVGYCVRFVYGDNSYQMVSSFWSTFVTFHNYSGRPEIIHIPYHCDKDSLMQLIMKYYLIE